MSRSRRQHGKRREIDTDSQCRMTSRQVRKTEMRNPGRRSKRFLRLCDERGMTRSIEREFSFPVGSDD